MWINRLLPKANSASKKKIAATFDAQLTFIFADSVTVRGSMAEIEGGGIFILFFQEGVFTEQKS